jgi:hypothetical protein
MPCGGGNKVLPVPTTAKVIELLDGETQFGDDNIAAYHDGTMVTSVYKVQNPSDFDQIAANLKQSMTEILNANDWLMSRCRHIPDESRPTGRLAIVIEEKTKKTENYIHESVSDKVKSKSFDEVKTVLLEQRISYLNMLWDQDEGVLTKFGIISSADKSTCAVFFTLNHLIGDGATLYQLWKMLDPTVPVTTLQAERATIFDTAKYCETKTSVLPVGCEAKEFTNIYMANWMGPMMRKAFTQLMQRKPMNQFLVTLSQEEINKRKAQYSNGSVFVSTNDVILSWMQDLLPKINHIFMVVNFRNRIEGITTDMAGNYHQLPMLYNKDMQTPLTVRTWLNNIMNPGYEWKFPTKAEFKKYLGGVNTSWTGFYHHIEPQGLSHVAHFPVYPPQSAAGGQELDFIVFKSGKDASGVDEISVNILSRRPEITMASLLSDPMIKNNLSL